MDGDVLILKRCMVCQNPFVASKGTARCCARPECRGFMADFEEFSALRFILVNVRWAGGDGLESPREWMELAIDRLPVSADLLAKVLIELLEETASSQS